MFNILLKQAESHEDGPSEKEDGKSDEQGRTGHPDGVIPLD